MARTLLTCCILCFAICAFSPELLAESRSGIVKVVSKPEGASVYLNGRIYGPTPVLLELKPGVHSLVVSMDGYPPKVRKIQVQAGRVVTDVVELNGDIEKNEIRIHDLKKGGKDAGPGTVTVTTEPPGLTVEINNMVVKKKTPVAFDIHSGIYRLRIRQDGQVVVEKTLFVRAGRTTDLDFTVKKRRSIDDKDPWQ